MKRFFPYTIAIICGVAATSVVYAAPASTGPRWENRSADSGSRPLAGNESLRVTRDGIERAAGVHFAIRITRTQETIECDKLPYDFHWDTTRVPDGWHWLEIVLIDPNSPTGAPSEKIVDSLKVYVRNNSATPPPPPVIAGATEPIATTTAALAPIAEPAARSSAPLASRRGTFQGGRLPRMLTLPTAVVGASVSASIAESQKALALPRASALYKAGDTVYIGLSDGGIALWDEKSARGSVVRVPGSIGAVRNLCVGDNTIYWTAGKSDIVYAFRTKDRTVATFDASERSEGGRTSGTPWIERIATLGKRVVLMGTAATRVLEPDGSLKTLSDELPESVAENYSDTLVRCYVGSNPATNDALLLLATPDLDGGGGTVRVWTGNAQNPRGGWRDRGSITTGADLMKTSLLSPVLTPFGLALPEKSEGVGQVNAIQFAPIQGRDDVAPQMLSLGVTGEYNSRAPQSAERITCGGSGIWWAQNGIVLHVDPKTGKRDAYLPWNGAGNTVTALYADVEGAYVATDKGVRRIVLGQPTDTDGYGGYVRAPLGEEYAEPATDQDRKLIMGIEDWQGVRYKWGGTTKSGTDCSGFVGAMHQNLGVRIPRTSSEMWNTKQGKRVLDELHYGDTLVFPGHVALYIGNGRTAETVGGSSTSSNGSVSKATIWRRREVVVKRFLPDNH